MRYSSLTRKCWQTIFFNFLKSLIFIFDSQSGLYPIRSYTSIQSIRWFFLKNVDALESYCNFPSDRVVDRLSRYKCIHFGRIKHKNQNKFYISIIVYTLLCLRSTKCANLYFEILSDNNLKIDYTFTHERSSKNLKISSISKLQNSI